MGYFIPRVSIFNAVLYTSSNNRTGRRKKQHLLQQGRQATNLERTHGQPRTINEQSRTINASNMTPVILLMLTGSLIRFYTELAFLVQSSQRIHRDFLYHVYLPSLSSGPVLRHLAESSITTTEINL